MRLLLALLCAAGYSCAATTLIQDTIQNADGTTFSGTLYVSWPTFYSGTQLVVSGSKTVTVKNGAISTDLYPTDNSNPAGALYSVRYATGAGSYMEYWQVPTSASPVTIADCRALNPTSATYFPVTDLSAYDFNPRVPGGQLIAGNPSSALLKSCPSGIAGDGSSSLYITGGIGTPEAVVIVSMTGTSPSPSCTVSFTPLNNHSGAWTLKSATSGAQEYLNTIRSTGGTLAIGPPGLTVLAPLSVYSNHTSIVGAGPGTEIDCRIDSGACIVFDGTHVSGGVAARNQLRGIVITNSSGTYGTSRTLVAINSQNSFVGDNLGLFFGTTAIHIDDPDTYSVMLNHLQIGAIQAGGRGLGIDNMAGDLYVSDSYINGNNLSSPCDAAIEIKGGGGFYFTSISSLNCTNGLRIDPSTPVDYLFCTNCVFDASAGDSVLLAPSGNGYISTAVFSNSWTSSAALNGMNCAPSGGSAYVTGLTITGHRALNNTQNGIFVQSGCSNVTISDSIISQSSTMSPGTYSGIAVGNNVDHVSIIGNRSGALPGYQNTQQYGILITGPSDNYLTIRDNDLTLPNITAGLVDNSTSPVKLVRNLGQSVLGPIVSASSIDPGATDPIVLSITGTASPVKSILRGWDGRQLTLVKSDSGTVVLGDGTGNIAGTTNLTQNGSATCTYVVGFGLYFCK